MVSYRVKLREVRLAADGTDDVALFDVERGEDGAKWIVPAYLSPLFRLVRMSAPVSADSRRDMVGGLGARAICDRLSQGVDPSSIESVLFTLEYPGAPGDPQPLFPYEDLAVDVKKHSSE